MDYVESDSPPGCIFCEPEGAVADRDRLILHRGEHVFVLLNRYPYAPGHLMVAPYAHEARLAALTDEARDELMERIADSAAIVEQAYGAEGLNVGANLGRAAGAGFADHLHFHLVPRWSGDTNFMTAIGELRVIPKHLQRIYDELIPRFAELAS
jgi:ATP adenylyltransferase